MAEQPLASFSLTHVHYDPTDPISHLCAWLALLPQGLCIVYATLLYTTREVEIGLTFGGQLCCEVLNFALKRWIKEARPDAIAHLGTGYGMPSSHAQFVAFFAVYVGLFMFWRHSPSYAPLKKEPSMYKGNGAVIVNDGERETSDSEEVDNVSRAASISPVYALQLHYPRLTHTLLTIAIFGMALSVAASRIYLSYHTPKQVAVGLGAGAAFAMLWFGITEWARRAGWVEWVLDWGIVRSARVRDLICEEDLVELGWQVWEDKRRRRKLGNGKRVRLVEPKKDLVKTKKKK